FSLNSIGSGEGNQTFGWGLYFAENKDVAQFYRSKLSGSRQKLMRGDTEVNPDSWEYSILRTIMDDVKGGKSIADSKAEIRGDLEFRKTNAARFGDDVGELNGALDMLESLSLDDYRDADVGHLYEVEIPEPDQF